MNKLWAVFIGFILIVIMAFAWYINGLNTAVQKDEAVNSAWAQVENQLQRRFDLIPNLVSTVKGYAAHEKETFMSITEARSQWGKAKSINEKVASAGEMTSAISRLLMVSENYPQLKADQNFLNLQTQLEGTENRLSVERKRYNEAVRDLNLFTRKVFGSFFAKQKGIEKRDYFEVEAVAKENPKVAF